MDFYRVILSGAGFLADAYDLFVINVAVDIMDQVEYNQPLTKNTKAAVKSMALVGAVFGQLFFGSIADVIGRKKVFIATCALVIIGAVMSAISQDTDGSFGTIYTIYRIHESIYYFIIIFNSIKLNLFTLQQKGIYSQLSLWRFVLGFGVGGEYPLSAAITSESASPEQRARSLAMVFSMQGA